MEPTLHRRLGVPGIVFMVVAAAAPITVVVANFPIIIGSSGSLGAPIMILAATIILLLFSVGYAWMTPAVPDAGAFYAYVDRGLGGRPGRGTAALALFSYVLLTVSMTCYLGVQAGNLVELWTGAQVPWWAISALMIVIVGLLGYRDIELSAKVLAVVLVLEVVAVVTIDIGVLASGRELVGAAFSPAEALSGAPGLGLLFAFLGFFGFEATAVFRDEARVPERTVPRATYIAVLLIGVLYVVSSWLVISGLGADDAVTASTDRPDRVVVELAGDVVAPILADVVQVLVVTSMFACMLAFHNIVTRYLYTLGRRRVLPAALGAVHAAHGAPSRASLWVTGTTAVVVIVSALAQLDPVLQIYTWYSGAGALGVIAMMTLTSAAVVTFAMRRRRGTVGATATEAGTDEDGAAVDAPATRAGRAASPAVVAAAVLGGLGLVLVLVLSVANFPVLVGGGVAAAIWGGLIVAVFVAGLLLPTRRTSGEPDAATVADATSAHANGSGVDRSAPNGSVVDGSGTNGSDGGRTSA